MWRYYQLLQWFWYWISCSFASDVAQQSRLSSLFPALSGYIYLGKICGTQPYKILGDTFHFWTSFCVKILATRHWKGLDDLVHPQENLVTHLSTFIVQIYLFRDFMSSRVRQWVNWDSKFSSCLHAGRAAGTVWYQVALADPTSIISIPQIFIYGGGRVVKCRATKDKYIK